MIARAQPTPRVYSPHRRGSARRGIARRGSARRGISWRGPAQLRALAALLTLPLLAGAALGQDATEREASDSQIIIIGPAESDPAAGTPGSPAAGAPEQSPTPAATADREQDTAPVSLAVDRLWLEYGQFASSDSAADQQGYLHGRVTLEWDPGSRWDVQLQVRGDGYYQRGDRDADRTELDYGESWLRYNGDNSRLTLGTQTVLWGRIDEFSPIDRLSTQDFSRLVLDDLEDRRRASPAVRFEYYAGNGKLDVLLLPSFRAAELPEEESVWFPIDQERGLILGLESTPGSAEIIRNARIDLDEPDTEGGAGIRYSATTSALDYGLSVQRGRQSVPYFVYDAASNTLRDSYPRTWILGGDLAFEAGDGILRLEAAWLSDTPVTRTDGRVEEVESLSWGIAYELFPGDADARINLQLLGTRLLDAPRVLDRTEIYTLGGSWDTPFANETWRFKLRFQVGLDERDVYLNPELTWTGWSGQELYLEAHYFDGTEITPGGFYEDQSLVALGWRIHF